MIQKIKELLAIQEELKSLHGLFQTHIDQTKELTTQITTLKEEVHTLKQGQKILADQLRNDTASIQDCRDDLHKETADFKLIKSRLEKKLVESFEHEIKEHLETRLNKLDEILKSFSQLGVNGEGLKDDLLSAKSEINKLVDVTKHIKASDFELTQHTKQVLSMDKEKLELMRKIDSLERLVSTLRRKR